MFLTWAPIKLIETLLTEAQLFPEPYRPQDVFIAALLTYIISHGLVRIRDRFGTQNVAAKTLIDERFLI